MPARVQAGDAGRFFEHDAAVARLRRDDRADAALAHDRRRLRAGGGVGEQKLHVARAHLAPVHLVGRALAALDAARDFDLVAVVIGFGRVALRVLEEERHFGEIARRAFRRAAEDDVVHLAAAHALGRGLAHRPRQRVDQVRLAAAVGADDAGEAGLDGEIGGFDEGFEAGEPELDEVHARYPNVVAVIDSS